MCVIDKLKIGFCIFYFLPSKKCDYLLVNCHRTVRSVFKIYDINLEKSHYKFIFANTSLNYIHFLK